MAQQLRNVNAAPGNWRTVLRECISYCLPIVGIRLLRQVVAGSTYAQPPTNDSKKTEKTLLDQILISHMVVV